MTLPNLLSVSRMALVPALLSAAWVGSAVAFLVLLAVAASSDLTDGYLARRWGQTSELGAQLDGWGDLSIYLTVPLCAWWLWPDLISEEAVCVGIVLVSYAFTTAVGFAKYGRLESFHTWGGKVSAVCLAAGALFLLVEGSPWPFRLATAIVVLADVEELAIMAILPYWRRDVATFWHAMNLPCIDEEGARDQTPQGTR